MNPFNDKFLQEKKVQLRLIRLSELVKLGPTQKKDNLSDIISDFLNILLF